MIPGRRWLRRALAGVLLVVVLGGLYVGITFLEVWSAARHDSHPRADAIVVLGAAQYNGRPSPVLKARLAHGLDLYRAGVAPIVVVTGGKQAGDRFTEATTGYNWLRERGVPDTAIMKEVQGRNTWESLSAVSNFLRGKGIKDVVLVSDDFHAARLADIAREVGLKPHVSPAGRELLSTSGEWRGLVRETLKVSVGRLIGYRHLSNLTGGH